MGKRTLGEVGKAKDMGEARNMGDGEIRGKMSFCKAIGLLWMLVSWNLGAWGRVGVGV